MEWLWVLSKQQTSFSKKVRKPANPSIRHLLYHEIHQCGRLLKYLYEKIPEDTSRVQITRIHTVIKCSEADQSIPIQPKE